MGLSSGVTSQPQTAVAVGDPRDPLMLMTVEGTWGQLEVDTGWVTSPRSSQPVECGHGPNKDEGPPLSPPHPGLCLHGKHRGSTGVVEGWAACVGSEHSCCHGSSGRWGCSVTSSEAGSPRPQCPRPGHTSRSSTRGSEDGVLTALHLPFTAPPGRVGPPHAHLPGRR